MINSVLNRVLSKNLANSDSSTQIAIANSSGDSVTYLQLKNAALALSSILNRHSEIVANASTIVATGNKVLDAVFAISCLVTGVRFTIVDRQQDDRHRAYVCSHSDATLVALGPDSDVHHDWISNQVKQILHLSIHEGVIHINGTEIELEDDVVLVPKLCDLLPQAIFYTSGSTGLPKGIIVARRQLADGATCVSSYLGLSENDVILSYLPLSFDYGFNQLLCALTVGGRVILEDEFAPLKVAANCTQFQPTVFPGSPSIFLNLGKLIRRRQDISCYASLRILTNTGGRVPEAGHDFIRAMVQAYGTRPFLMYGLTECFRSSFLPPDLYFEKHNAIGYAIPGVSLYLQDENGKIIDVPHTIGEIIHSGRLISYGYFKDSEATERLMTKLNHPSFVGVPNPPQAVKSGDLGWFDEDGVFFHAGRKDNLVKVREHRISLGQIENLIAQSGCNRLDPPCLAQAASAADANDGTGFPLRRAAMTFAR